MAKKTTVPKNRTRAVAKKVTVRNLAPRRKEDVKGASYSIVRAWPTKYGG